MQIRQECETIAAAPHRPVHFQSMDVHPIGSRRQAICRHANGVAGRLQDHDFPTRVQNAVNA